MKLSDGKPGKFFALQKALIMGDFRNCEKLVIEKKAVQMCDGKTGKVF